MAKTKKKSSPILLFIFSSLICLLMIEGFFRLLNPPYPTAKSRCANDSEVCLFAEYHPILGFHGQANRVGRFLGKWVQHNEEGHRTPPVKTEKPGNTKRIIFVGDSQTWGFGVHNKQTIPYVLETKLNAARQKGEDQYQVINIGFSGYGTDQSYLSFLLHGLQYQPDVLVYTLFPNDLIENEHAQFWGVNKPRFFVKKNELCLSHVPVERQQGWDNNYVLRMKHRYITLSSIDQRIDLARYASLRFFMNREWPTELLMKTQDVDLTPIQKHINCIQEKSEIFTPGDTVAKFLIARMHQTMVQNGGQFLVLIVPRMDEVLKPHIQTYYRTILAYLKKNNIAHIDLKQPLIQTFKQNPRQLFDDSSYGTPHLLVEGNQLAANEVLKVLKP